MDSDNIPVMFKANTLSANLKYVCFMKGFFLELIGKDISVSSFENFIWEYFGHFLSAIGFVGAYLPMKHPQFLNKYKVL